MIYIYGYKLYLNRKSCVYSKDLVSLTHWYYLKSPLLALLFRA